MSPHAHRAQGETLRARLGLLTVSDTRTEETDVSGAAARRLLEKAGHEVIEALIVPDEPDAVRDRVQTWLGNEACDAVLVTGGTGIAARDRTYEAVGGLLEKRLEGFGELFRLLSYAEVGSAAMLSRAVAGIARGRAVFVVPGAPAAVRLALEKLILPELGHLLAELRRKGGNEKGGQVD